MNDQSTIGNGADLYETVYISCIISPNVLVLPVSLTNTQTPNLNDPLIYHPANDQMRLKTYAKMKRGSFVIRSGRMSLPGNESHILFPSRASSFSSLLLRL